MKLIIQTSSMVRRPDSTKTTRSTMTEYKGYVEHIIYRNEENTYTVFEVQCEDGLLTCHYCEKEQDINKVELV